MEVGKDAKKMLFLLGGYDLEMLTIREVLEKQGMCYADHQLSWHNARVSSYRKEIEEASAQGYIIWGVELQEDMVVPSLYKKIDHHNELAHLPSSLEQIMNILHLPMDRHLQLVAANDKAYIPGMLQLGATAEELEAIRRADRKAQGITEEDEQLAERAIAENCERSNSLLMVRAFNSRFAPICDRLFPYRCLLIYTDSEWMYYGEGAVQICQLFEEDFKSGKVFCGGGENGYVGTVKNLYSEKELMEMIYKIKRL